MWPYLAATLQLCSYLAKGTRGQQKSPKKGRRLHGKASSPALWCPSAEQIVQTAHSHLLFSPWYIVCALAFHSARKVALWAYKQTVQKRANHPLLFPGELAFLFQLQAVKDLESLCQCPELIALSWSRLHGLPNVQKMFINNDSSRILAPSCPLVVAFIWLPHSHPWPLAAGSGRACLSSHRDKISNCLEWKNTHLCIRTCVIGAFVLSPERSQSHRNCVSNLDVGRGGSCRPCPVQAHLARAISRGSRRNSLLLLSLPTSSPKRKFSEADNLMYFEVFLVPKKSLFNRMK